MNVLAVCHSDGKSQASALKKNASLKNANGVIQICSHMSIIHTFWGEIFIKISITELYLKMVGVLFFYIVLPRRQDDVEIIFHNLLYILWWEILYF